MSPTTDTSEKGLESLLVAAMTGKTRVAPLKPGEVGDSEAGFGGTSWILGEAKAYDREYAVDLVQLSEFIYGTQKPMVEAFDLEHETPTRLNFLARLQGEIAKRGVIDVLRRGSSTEHIMLISSMALLLLAMKRQKNFSPRTASALVGSSSTAEMRHNLHWIFVFSSMGCRSPHLN
jgi:hypothetical protein